MNYTPLNKEDCDESFQYKKLTIHCYSEKRLKQISSDKEYKIIGLARKKDKKAENELILENKSMSVVKPDSNSVKYKNIGYVPISENEYIAIQQSRIPFLLALGTIIATTVLICFLILNIGAGNVKSETLKTFNPLPPVDTNIKDYVEDSTATDETNSLGAGRATLRYRSRVDLDLSNGQITMQFQNPQNSNYDAVLELYLVSNSKECLVSTSGRIPAGKQLSKMQLKANKTTFAGEGKYNAEYRVIYYDPYTGERVLKEAKIVNVILTVRND